MKSNEIVIVELKINFNIIPEIYKTTFKTLTIDFGDRHK
jgi:hypothetical protein